MLGLNTQNAWSDYVTEYVVIASQALAAARCAGKWLHVDRDGTPVYAARFDHVGKFVDVGNGRYLAAVQSGNAGYHITPDGKPAYAARFACVGDFEPHVVTWLAPVNLAHDSPLLRTRVLRYAHIDASGTVVD